MQRIEDSRLDFFQLCDLQPRELGNMFGGDGQKLYDAIRLLPCVDAEAIIKPITGTIIRIEATVTPIFYWNDRLLGAGGLQRFWAFTEDLDDNMILHYEPLLLPKEPHKLVFAIPIHDRQIQHQYQLRVASDSYVVDDTIASISLHNCPLPTSIRPHTDLLPLYPLPLWSLNKEKYERLYNFEFFNPDKTHSFELELGVKTVQLSGGHTPKLEELEPASILITTPEKCDGIVRSWDTRNYVQYVESVVIDEERDAVVDASVTRLKMIAQKRELLKMSVRLIGISTALANAPEVPDWIGFKESGLNNFRPNIHTLPTELNIQDFSGQHDCLRMALMNKPALKAIGLFSPPKPTLLFDASRRQTRIGSLDRFSTRVGVRDGDDEGLTYAEKYDLRRPFTAITQLQLARQYGVYVPDLINESGHDCALNITVRTYAACGAPFRDEIRHTMDTNKSLSVDAWNALASLRVLLRHKIAQHSTTELRQELLPGPCDEDVEVAVALEKILEHLAPNSRRRFEANVDRLIVCPSCNQWTQRKGALTPVYYYALNDVNYSEPHDQRVGRLNFNSWEQSFDAFALSPRLVENFTCNHCGGRFAASNGDKIRCKERLTDVATPIFAPRWVILYLCHDETNVKDLQVTPHARQPFHGYLEQVKRGGRYRFNTSSQRPYKLKAYGLLAKPNYDHAVLRQAVELNGVPVQWLQLDDQDMMTIDQHDFYREGQKIEFLLYESVDQGEVIASETEPNLPRLRERKQKS